MPAPPVPVQLRAPVVARRPVGAYLALRLAAPAIATTARPGQFVAVAVGGDRSAMLTRRAFSLAGWCPADGTVEVVFAVTGRGTGWLAGRRRGDRLDVVGPLGRPFGLAGPGEGCLLVGGGYGAAPLLPLAAALRDRGCPVAVALGAASRRRLYGVAAARRLTAAVAVGTDDGSAGRRALATELAAELAERVGARRVYACGPMGMLAATAAFAAVAGLACQVALEESMACGIGVCMTCVLPVVGEDGVTRMSRACVDGPVYPGERVRFGDVGTVPAGTEGGPPGGGGAA